MEFITLTVTVGLTVFSWIAVVSVVTMFSGGEDDGTEFEEG